MFGGRDSDPILLGDFGKEVSGVAWHADDITNLATCCDDLTLQVWRPSHELPVSHSPVCAGSQRPTWAGAMAAAKGCASKAARESAEAQMGLYSLMGGLVQISLGLVLLSLSKGCRFHVKAASSSMHGQPHALVCSMLSAWECLLCMLGW